MHKLPLTVAILLAADAGAPAKPLFGKPPGNHPVPVYARAELPPLLEFLDGRKVTSNADWKKRREEIRSLLIKYFIGMFKISFTFQVNKIFQP